MSIKKELVLLSGGVYWEHYDVTGWSSADWRKYHAFIRSMAHKSTRLDKGGSNAE